MYIAACSVIPFRITYAIRVFLLSVPNIFQNFRISRSDLLPKDPNSKHTGGQRDGGAEKPPPPLRNSKHLFPIFITLETKERHAKYRLHLLVHVRLQGPTRKREEEEGRHTETKVPGRKNIVTAAMVIIELLSFLASSASAVVALEISRLVSLSSCVDR